MPRTSNPLDPVRPDGRPPTREQLAVLDWLVGDLRAFASHHTPDPDLLGPDEITAADTAAADAIRDYADRLAARIAKTRHEHNLEQQ